jgi:hypothetical protein
MTPLGTQALLPSHTPLETALFALAQLVNVQELPRPATAQAPLPSHRPVVPQVFSESCPHCSYGSSVARTLPQVPLLPPLFLARQETHVPAQAVLQHTPSLQKPLVQSLPCTQAEPLPVPVAPTLLANNELAASPSAAKNIRRAETRAR